MSEFVPEVLAQLAEHGLAPGAATPPALLRDALNDLYRYEIRRLKARLLAGDVAQSAYVDHVLALRRKYWLLSVPVRVWTRS